jgi:hypothetical protein
LLAKPTPPNINLSSDRFAMFNKKWDISYRYANPYRYQYAGLYNYRYARPYVYGYTPAYNYRYARPYGYGPAPVYYNYAPSGY